jgi:NAD(P)-dependent dehydrogenase (short-subunit alcohol dehydrogenase family)
MGRNVSAGQEACGVPRWNIADSPDRTFNPKVQGSRPWRPTHQVLSDKTNAGIGAEVTKEENVRGLSGKVVVVAGGATGIGAATAQRLAAEGAAVVVGDVAADSLRQTVAGIRDSGKEAVAVEVDVSDEDSVRRLASAAVEHFGGVDGWHNNAADTSQATVGVDLQTDVMTVPIPVWQRSFEVNLQGYVHGIRAAIPLFLERDGGAMVHTASDGAFAALPNLAAYNATKAAIVSLSRHVAARWGRQGIRSNVVSPGLILTEVVKARLSQDDIDGLAATGASTRVGRPDDIAAAVAFLLSDDAAFINGQVLSVNGGSLTR